MNYKAVLIDFDGVICNSKYFREVYAEKFGMDINILTPFFDNLKETVVIGKGDLKDQLAEIIDTWGWKGTVDELLEFWLTEDPDIDIRFIEIAQKLQGLGLKVYLATDQEKYRAQHIWETRGLQNWMDGKFVSSEIGHHKDRTNFFHHVIKTLDCKPDQILFFDDSEKKVLSAKSAGVKGFVFKDFERFVHDLNKILSINL